MAHIPLQPSKQRFQVPWESLAWLAPAAELVLLAVAGVCLLGFALMVFVGPLIAALDAVQPESIMVLTVGFSVCGVVCFLCANALGDWHLRRNRSR